MTDTNKQLIDQVQHIVRTLENPPTVTSEDPTLTTEDAGWAYDENEETWRDANGSELPDDYVQDMSGFDYLSDVLDVEWRVGSDKTYRSAKILVAFGGPNVWIDTDSEKVIGAWWGDYYEESYTDNMGLNEACEELFNC
jgi:hypothetical protein